MRFENFGSFCFTLLYDVLRIPLQFEMSSGDSIERTERANGFIGETRNSQYNGLSEDCIKSGSGGSECGKSVSNSTFLRNGERAPSEETLRDESERISESELVPLADHPIHATSSDLQETDPRDRPHQRAVLDFCPSTLTVRGNGDRRKRNFVTFNPEVTIHLIPYEDRSSQWMQCAIDRAHFQRRVQLLEELFTAL